MVLSYVDIVSNFRANWTGTDAELAECLDEFYHKVRRSLLADLGNFPTYTIAAQTTDNAVEEVLRDLR